MKGGFLRDHNREALVGVTYKSAEVVDCHDVHSLVEVSGEAAFRVLPGNGIESGSKGSVRSSFEEERHGGVASSGGRSFQFHAGRKVCSGDVKVASDVGSVDRGVGKDPIPSWDGNDLVFLVVISVSRPKRQAERRSAGRNFDAVDEVFAMAVELIPDEDEILAILGNFEINAAVGNSLSLVIVCCDRFVVFGSANLNHGIHGGAQAAGEDLSAEILAFLGTELEPIVIPFLG